MRITAAGRDVSIRLPPVFYGLQRLVVDHCNRQMRTEPLRPNVLPGERRSATEDAALLRLGHFDPQRSGGRRDAPLWRAEVPTRQCVNMDG